jgi:long-chain acyl-CoA synthetase
MTPLIVLTGTGTIGREVLLRLVRDAERRVAVLVRPRGRRPAVQRADALLTDLALTTTERQRVVVVSGDITHERLGLDPATHDRLARSAEVIIHTAAVTSLTADRELCDRVNCGGTANALTLAEQAHASGRLRRFLHVSTALVAGAHGTGVAREEDLPADGAHANHYEWSKCKAERIVRAAMSRGLPVSIVRPGMVVGDTKTGFTRDFNVIYPLMRMMASGYITRFPADPAAHLHIAPIDFVVEAITQSIDNAWTNGKTFHLTAPKPPTVGQLFDCDAFFPSRAPRPTLCAPDRFELSTCEPRERALLESVAFCFPYFASRLSFDTTNTCRLMPAPVTDAAYLDRLGRYAVESGYLRHAAS